MARGSNQVTLTFAGDHDQLTKSFDEVGASAKDMSGDVGSASTDMASTSGKSFDTMGSKVGDAEGKMRGFRDIVDGTGDVARGFAEGDISLVTKGFADIAAGSTALVIPALKRFVTWLGNTRVGILAKAAAEKIGTAATKTMTAAQRALNFAMRMNPIGFVVTAIALLVAGIVVAYKRSETFRKIVKGAFEAIVNAGKFLWEGIKKYFGFWFGIVDRVVDAVQGIPGRIKRGFSRLFDIITSPFRSAFNFVADAWNNTIGRLSWSVPSWVPGVGGNSISAPSLPKFHQGGMASGARGREFLAVLRAGERVTPTAGGGRQTVRLAVERGDGGGSVEQAMADVILHLVRTGALALNVREGQVTV